MIPFCMQAAARSFAINSLLVLSTPYTCNFKKLMSKYNKHIGHLIKSNGRFNNNAGVL